MQRFLFSATLHPFCLVRARGTSDNESDGPTMKYNHATYLRNIATSHFKKYISDPINVLTVRGTCGLIWLNTGNLTRPGHRKDWQIESSFVYRRFGTPTLPGEWTGEPGGALGRPTRFPRSGRSPKTILPRAKRGVRQYRCQTTIADRGLWVFCNV